MKKHISIIILTITLAAMTIFSFYTWHQLDRVGGRVEDKLNVSMYRTSEILDIMSKEKDDLKLLNWTDVLIENLNTNEMLLDLTINHTKQDTVQKVTLNSIWTFNSGLMSAVDTQAPFSREELVDLSALYNSIYDGQLGSFDQLLQEWDLSFEQFKKQNEHNVFLKFGQKDFSVNKLEDGDIASLVGILKVVDYYGPPGYGETPETDLQLSTYVVEVEGLDTEVQLALHGRDHSEEIKAFVGKPIDLRGVMFEAHTGYHIRPMLMSVVTMDWINDRKIKEGDVSFDSID